MSELTETLFETPRTPRTGPSADELLEGLNEPQRAAVVHEGAPLLVVAGALPTVPLLYFADRLLVLAGQPPEVAALAQPYTLRLLPYYFGYVLMSAVQRVYQALEYNWSNFVITAVACAASRHRSTTTSPPCATARASCASGLRKGAGSASSPSRHAIRCTARIAN